MEVAQWFDELAGRLADADRTDDSWAVYEVRTGPVAFELVVAPDSGFADIHRAFHDAAPAAPGKPGAFRIWCLDKRHERMLPPLRLTGGEVRACFQRARESASHRVLLPEQEWGAVKAFDAKHRVAVFYAEDCARLPPWERYSPLKSFVHLLALQAQAVLLHAGSVAQAGRRGILLAGPGGSGKSTTTLRLLENGLVSAGDDYVLAEPRADGSCRVHAAYRTLKLHPSAPLALGARQGYERWETDPLSGKQVLLANRAGEPGPLAGSFMLAAIAGLSLAPENGPGPGPRSPAFMHFALSSVQQAPYWAGRALAMAKRVYEAAPYADLSIARGAAGMADAARRIQALMES
ncbi:hypothetical protein PIGHUM_03198 [Pigmentiphaga humi]|uniref:HPr kinase/phosphorylase n=1 Tax=Pigmentiphaga humi TaxID=2478468 RepID=A0A3P4B490_9BURK|nr:hypothetical protein [Pigmentiphaga humi]VCU71117.1 hypothetical protein PIGHUM_03198 [Pigmentiphaga humi]